MCLVLCTIKAHLRTEILDGSCIFSLVSWRKSSFNTCNNAVGIILTWSIYLNNFVFHQIITAVWNRANLAEGGVPAYKYCLVSGTLGKMGKGNMCGWEVVGAGLIRAHD